MTTTWTFFTNHAHVLFLLVQDPELRLRDVADRVGITERAVQRIVRELSEDGYLSVERHGRRNRYRVRRDLRLRHEVEAHLAIGDLLETVLGPLPPEEAAPEHAAPEDPA